VRLRRQAAERLERDWADAASSSSGDTDGASSEAISPLRTSDDSGKSPRGALHDPRDT